MFQCFKGRYNYLDNIRGFKYAPTVVEASDYAIANRWATLCYPADVELNADVQAFKATAVNDDVLELVEITGTIPANEPVLLFCDACATLALPAASHVISRIEPIRGSEGNLLVGCMSPLTLNQNTQFILQKQNDEVAFYRVNPSKAITTKPYRSYLEVPAASESKLRLSAVDDDATAITDIKAAIDSAAYDINGRRVQNLKKGYMYIINNQKVIIK